MKSLDRGFAMNRLYLICQNVLDYKNRDRRYDLVDVRLQLS